MTSGFARVVEIASRSRWGCLFLRIGNCP